MEQTSLIIGPDDNGEIQNKDLNDMLSEGWHVVMMEAFGNSEKRCYEGHILVILEKAIDFDELKD